MKKVKSNNVQPEDNPSTAEKEICDLMSKAILDTSVRHENTHLVKCWEIKKCGKTDCPSYESKDLRCWQAAGTFCGGRVQGFFAQKYGNCKECDVFKTACNTEQDHLGEQFNNMMHLLQVERKKVDALNEQLIHSLDSLERKNNEILKLTVTDNLTNLYTRSYLFKAMESEMERCRRYNHPLSILVMDIDGFKTYNDKYGHLEGDTLLKKLGQIIKKSVRNTDYACRFGGDEFVVILPETEQTIALVVADRIRLAIKSHTFYPDRDKGPGLPVNRTVSVGSYTVIGATEDIKDLIERADEAMYEAKRSGGDKVVISPYSTNVSL